MKKTLLFAALCVLPLCAAAQERLDSVVVSATRAGKETPVTYDMVGQGNSGYIRYGREGGTPPE